MTNGTNGNGNGKLWAALGGALGLAITAVGTLVVLWALGVQRHMEESRQGYERIRAVELRVEQLENRVEKLERGRR